MQKLFNHLLVPLDITSASSAVADRAADLAVEYGCRLQLLHVVTESPFIAAALCESPVMIPYDVLDEIRSTEEKMQQLEKRVWKRTGGRIQVKGIVQYGSWLSEIRTIVETQGADLVLLGYSGGPFRKKKWVVNPDTVARQNRIPVITVAAAGLPPRMRSILVPVTDFLPVRKLIYAVYIASMSKGTIRLLGIANSATRSKVHHYLGRAYQLILENSDLEVEIDKVEGDNVASVVQAFNSRHPADLIILNPGTQTRLPGLLSAFWRNIIQKSPATPVLTVTPLVNE